MSGPFDKLNCLGIETLRQGSFFLFFFFSFLINFEGGFCFAITMTSHKIIILKPGLSGALSWKTRKVEALKGNFLYVYSKICEEALVYEKQLLHNFVAHEKVGIVSLKSWLRVQ